MTPTAYLIIGLSLALNIFFIFEYVDSWVEKKVEILEETEGQQSILFEEKLFSEDFELADYSSTKFTLEEKGRDIIKNARKFHSSPALIKGEAYEEAMCAAYVFELSRIMWDLSAPYMIGMMEQNTKTVADAWQLPYSYEYVGGKILSDFTGDFSLDEKNYWESIDILKLEDFFDLAFSEQALFGDIGFFYKDTEFIQDLKVFENSNSHIAKNIGTSRFQRKISRDQQESQDDAVAQALSCDADIYSEIKPLLQHYELYLDEKRIVLQEDNFYYLAEDNTLGDLVVFTDMSSLSFQDITLMHFYEGAQVQSLFEMTCQGEFFPINIMQINPRFIEKM